MAGISYAGVPLLLLGDDGVISDFIRNNLPIDDTFWFSGGANYPGPAFRHSGTDPFQLPFASYTRPPRMSLNRLYWPTGPMRWGCFLGLIGESSLREIDWQTRSGVTTDPETQAETGAATARPFPLVLNDGDTSVTIPMYCLPPMQVTCQPPDGSETLFFLMLVDHRYFWQYSVAFFQADPNEDWGVNINAKWPEPNSHNSESQELNISPIPVEYGRLSTRLPTGQYSAGAMLFDAMIHSVGMRYVMDLDGSEHVLSWGASGNRMDEYNLSPIVQTVNELAGGSGVLSTISEPKPLPSEDDPEPQAPPPRELLSCMGMPSSFQLLVPRSGEALNALLTLVNASDVIDGYGEHEYPVVKYMQTTAQRVTGGNQEQSPESFAAWARALSRRMATDYYSSQTRRYDRVFAGIKKWQMTGWDDYLMIEIGSRASDGGMACQTRVRSHPPDFCTDWNLSDPIPTGCWCDTFPQAWRVEVAGILEGTCDQCASYNGVFTLRFREFLGSGECNPVWESDEKGGCGIADDQPRWYLTGAGIHPGFFYLYSGADPLSPFATQTNILTFTNTSSPNCLGQNTLRLVNTGFDPNTFLSYCRAVLTPTFGFNATANISPLP